MDPTIHPELQEAAEWGLVDPPPPPSGGWDRTHRVPNKGQAGINPGGKGKGISECPGVLGQVGGRGGGGLSG